MKTLLQWGRLAVYWLYDDYGRTFFFGLGNHPRYTHRWFVYIGRLEIVWWKRGVRHA